MANESKKFALFACCLMTMQALRLVISTAGFCVVRFHIDPSLFGIFISRLVNAVLMSQLFGNWLGDLIVFTATGSMKLIAIAAGNWAEFLCFCSALVCICAGEQGILTGFYWSMVSAYFWWKVGEAPAISIGGGEVDWYFAGFTLSGVWAACLKGVVMMCLGRDTKTPDFHSEVLGEVNVTVVGDVSVVGARSVKTTVDYRAAKWLFIVVIVVMFLMCLVWEVAAWLKTGQVAPSNEEMTRDMVKEELEKTANEKHDGSPAARNTESMLVMELRALGTGLKVDRTTTTTQSTVDFSTAEVSTSVGVQNATEKDQITIEVGNVKVTSGHKSGETIKKDGAETMKVAEKVKGQLNGLIGAGMIEKVELSGPLTETPATNTWTVTATVAPGNQTRGYIGEALKKMAQEKADGSPAGVGDNKLVEAIKALSTRKVDVKGGSAATTTLDFSTAQVNQNGSTVKAVGPNQITITVTNVGSGASQGTLNSEGVQTEAVADAVKTQLERLVAGGWAMSVTLSGTTQLKSTGNTITVTATVAGGGWITKTAAWSVTILTCIEMAAVFAVPGALTFAWMGKIFNRGLKGWIIAGGLFGCCGGAVTTAMSVWGYQKLRGAMEEMWVPFFKWGGADTSDSTTWAAVVGLRKGIVTGSVVGLWIGTRKGATKSGFLGGAFIGGFFGLWIGEIYNGGATWNKPFKIVKGAAKEEQVVVVVCGFFIVVFGLGTVYSIYPGMAPCSITQFKYFNIIDIIILILSAMAPIVIMALDLAELPERLGKTIVSGVDDGAGGRLWGAIGMAVVMTIATLICEIVVINIMQNPHSKMAQQVTTSGWRACTLTILMVTFQLTSTGIGFACVAAGSGFNDGVYNSLSTLVLWTTECCGVLGEGYLTELKKYEPGKWPTQGMGKWATYKWWNNKAFGNAWQIWCCIATTDLRRDIMLCKQ